MRKEDLDLAQQNQSVGVRVVPPIEGIQQPALFEDFYQNFGMLRQIVKSDGFVGAILKG